MAARRRRRRRPVLRGLRLRLLLALLFTSAVTLIVASTVLLSPLQDKLRAQSASNLRGTVQDSAERFERALTEVKERGGDPFAVQGAAIDLRQRTDGRIIVGSTLCCTFTYDTDNGSRVDYSAARQAALTGLQALREQRTVTSIDGDVVRVAVRLLGRQPGILIAERRLTEVTNAVDQIRNALLAAAAVGLLVAIALAIALSSTLTRRLGRLRAAALRITEEGIDAPIEHDAGSDEVGDVARAFTRMQEALRRQEAARRSFVATASHELRTPLTMLQGTMELLEEDLSDGRVDVEDLRVQVARARRELLRLGALAGELLDLSRLDASVPLRSEWVELGELVRAVSAEFSLRAADRGSDLVVVPPEQACWAQGDPDAIARVVRILVDNALRYGPEGKPVELAAGCSGARAQVRVCDRGPGVHPAERDQIFERFQRGRTAGSEGGFGLGLAIGRELAERMHGTLELRGGPGDGTIFLLDLPAGDPEPDHAPGERPATVSP